MPMRSQIQKSIELADTAYQRGLCDQAVNQLLAAVQENPTAGELYLKLSEILVDSERYEDTLNFLAQIPTAYMTDYAFCILGFCHEALGDDAAAETSAESALRLNIDSALAYTLKGHIAARSGNWASAEGHYRKAVSCDAGCGLAYLMLGLLKWEQGNRPAAMNDFENAFTREPTDRRIATQYYSTAVALTEFDRAIASFRAALIQRRHNRRLRFLLIDLLLRKGDLEEAMGHIEAAMAEFGIDDGLLAAALAVRGRLDALPRVETTDKGCSVSLCMIVKNEEEHLARCLHSAKPIVAEIIVVDTGSTDRTKEIAKAFGARVFEVAWVNDFSIARNSSLSKASGDWIFVLDADEIVSSKDYEKFRALIGRQPSEPCAFSIQTRNYTLHSNTIGLMLNTGEYAEEEGIGWFPSDKVRLFRNDSRIRFVNPVHELVEPSLKELGIPICSCDIPVHHFGKLHEAKTQEKTKAYRDLGKKKLKKNCRSLAALRELAIQSAQVGRHEDAIRLWKDYLKLQPQSDEAQLNLGGAYWNCKRYRKATHCAEKALRLNPTSKEAKFNLAIAILMRGRAGEAKSILQGLLEEHRDYPAAQFMLCVASACVGDAVQAAAQIAKIRTTALGSYLGESFLDLAKRFFSASQLDYARRALETAVAHNYGNNEIFSLLEDIRAAA